MVSMRIAETQVYRAAQCCNDSEAAAGMGILPFSKEIFLALMEAEIPEKHRAVNRAAFEEAVKKIKLISTSQDGKQKVKSNV